MPHIDSEFIQQLTSALNGKITPELSSELISAMQSYALWKSKKSSLYPDVPEFYSMQKLDGTWTSPSVLKWKGRIIENKLYPLCEIGLICPHCESPNTCYSNAVDGQVCFSCDAIFSQEEGRRRLSFQLQQGNQLFDAPDEDDRLCVCIGKDVPKSTMSAKIPKRRINRQEIEDDDDEGFVTYGKK